VHLFADMNTATSPFAEELAFTKTLAAEAAAFALSQFGFAVARRKYDGTLVTATDEAVDRLITARIVAAYPDDAVLSEERVTRYNPAAGRTWVIDPLDGTTNFARGFPTWGVSIALLDKGMPIAGVVHFPALEEVFAATAQGGATRNGAPIQTLPASTNIGDDQVFMECTRTRRLFHVDLPFKGRILGSAAYHLCKVAQGCALGGIEATPKVWDIAAAALILTEAGGVIQPLTPGASPIFPLEGVAGEYGARSMPLVHAASAAVIDFALPSIQPKRQTSS
jgi:myo-inositol-1(or 4)-monophosphatase